MLCRLHNLRELVRGWQPGRGIRPKADPYKGNTLRGWVAYRVLKVIWVVPGRTQPDPRTKSGMNLGSILFSL